MFWSLEIPFKTGFTVCVCVCVCVYIYIYISTTALSNYSVATGIYVGRTESHEQQFFVK